MSAALLQQIRDLQFSDKGKAEALLLAFLREITPYDVVSVSLRPLAISLNSFNGFMYLADERRLFFKTHTESDTVIHEYYNAGLLAESGYPIIRPVFQSTEVGKQVLIYEVIEDASVFDVAWAIETGQSADLEALTIAQQAADRALWQIYRATLREHAAEQAAQAPIHQLFHHRLSQGRLERFYGNHAEIALPQGRFAMRHVRAVRWVINGQRYAHTLEDIITQALRLLDPAQTGMAIVGHGDAHNGNVFFQRKKGSLLYFDPAFAGEHHPLLDLTKPLFHNVFAMWMYFPHELHQRLPIAMAIHGDEWHVNYDATLHPVRQMFLHSKTEHVLKPLVTHLKAQGQLRDDWRAYLKAALFCCPFLTMNLTDSSRFPPPISLLGLAMAMEMGAESLHQRSLIDQLLDDVARVL